jgi:HD-GYP domain-containing protein (c-di-GMP phosphodiesterase class II)
MSIWSMKRPIGIPQYSCGHFLLFLLFLSLASRTAGGANIPTPTLEAKEDSENPHGSLPMKLLIQDHMRAQNVVRWNTVAMSVSQSLADHMYNVAMLALHISNKLDYHDPNRVAVAALYHDVDEVVCGDIPKNAKIMIKNEGVDINALFGGNEIELDELGGTILKTADMVETWFHVKQYGAGVHAEQVLKIMEQNMYDSIAGLEPKIKDVVVNLVADLISGKRRII